MTTLRPLLLGSLILATASGCGGPPPPRVTERLWLSELPTGPRQQVSAFVITQVRGNRLGVFYVGSLYRGAHDLFRWSGDDARGELELLQDGTVHDIRLEGCEPRTGFDHCILLHGDPTGVVRYHSRKRWALRARDEAPSDLSEIVAELAPEDPELRELDRAALRDGAED